MGGFEPLQISIGLAVGGLLFFAGLIYWGNRFKSLRRTTIILYGLGGGALLVGAAVAINHSAGMGDLARLVFAIPAVLGLFVLAGATPAAIGLLADVTEAYPDDRGAIMGLYSVFLGLGQIGGSIIAGFAASALGLDGIFVASLVLLILAVFPLVFLRRHEHYLAGPATPASID
jgi:predicted MFS family arabinose efflux permease